MVWAMLQGQAEGAAAHRVLAAQFSSVLVKTEGRSSPRQAASSHRWCGPWFGTVPSKLLACNPSAYTRMQAKEEK